jgi:hypothetical protein
MTPVLNNGIFLRDTVYNPLGTHFDRAHISNLSPTKPDDLGIIDIWAMRQKSEMPLYSLSSFKGKNVIYTDGHKYTWKIPTQSVAPYIVEAFLPADKDKVGQDGQTFQIKLNEQWFGHGSIFTYDKYNGAEMYVTDDPIIKASDGYVYTVKLVNNKNSQYIERQFLTAGTYVFRVGSARDEHSSMWDDFKFEGSGYREFFNYVGEASAHSHYALSEDAAVMGLKSEVAELIRFHKPMDPSVKKIEDLDSLTGSRTNTKAYMKAAYAAGDLSYTWTRKLDTVHMNKIANDIETYLMWGKGGFIRNAAGGANDVRMPVGLWKQLDNGYKRVYTRGEFNMAMFKSEIFNFFNGKVDWDGPDSSRKLIVQTGRAGMELVNNAIMKEINNSGMVINATDIGAVSGDRMSLEWGMYADKIKLPFLANLQFVYNAAFDNVHNNPIENPTVDGYALSSYSFVIFDYNEDQGNDNIKLLKYAPNGMYAESDLKYFYQNGTCDYMGKKTNFASTGDFSGYKVKFQMRYPTIWVADPTKILRFSMKNPITGSSL